MRNTISFYFTVTLESPVGMEFRFHTFASIRFCSLLSKVTSQSQSKSKTLIYLGIFMCVFPLPYQGTNFIPACMDFFFRKFGKIVESSPSWRILDPSSQFHNIKYNELRIGYIPLVRGTMSRYSRGDLYHVVRSGQ